MCILLKFHTQVYQWCYVPSIITGSNLEVSSTLYTIYNLSAQNLDQISEFFAPQLDLHTVLLILRTYYAKAWKYDSLLKHTVHKVNLQEDLFCPAGVMHFSFQRELIALIHFLTNFSVLILKGLNNFYKVSIIKKVTIEHTLKKIILKLLEPNWTFLDCY